MWMADYNNLRGKSHGYIFSLVDIAAAALKSLPPSIKGVSPDVSVGFFFVDDDSGWPGDYQGFTVSLGGAIGLNLGRYVNATTVQYCDYDMDCALFNWREEGRPNGLRIAVKERDKEGITVDIYNPGETPRTNVDFERHTITDKRDYQRGSGKTAERICFRHNFKELRYLESGRNCDKGVALKVEGALDEDESSAGADRSVRRDPLSAGFSEGINTLGLWDFQAKGQTVTDEFIQQTDDYVILRRHGTTQKRRCDKVDANTYRNDRGATFRFVNATRGIWVSPDGDTVYQLRKR